MAVYSDVYKHTMPVTVSGAAGETDIYSSVGYLYNLMVYIHLLRLQINSIYATNNFETYVYEKEHFFHSCVFTVFHSVYFCH